MTIVRIYLYREATLNDQNEIKCRLKESNH